MLSSLASRSVVGTSMFRRCNGPYCLTSSFRSISTKSSLVADNKDYLQTFTRTNRQHLQAFQPNWQGQSWIRSMSTTPPPPPSATTFTPKPPDSLNMEMARGIQESNLLILRHGIGKQRLLQLAESTEEEVDLTMKWQQMMEIYLTCQLHMVAALGYPTNEQGIMQYTQQLAQFVTTCSPEVQEEFRAKGRETWREMLTVAFDLQDILDDTNATQDELSVVDARNIMHQVSSQLIEPNILNQVATQCSQLPHGTFIPYFLFS